MEELLPRPLSLFFCPWGHYIPVLLRGGLGENVTEDLDTI